MTIQTRITQLKLSDDTPKSLGVSYLTADAVICEQGLIEGIDFSIDRGRGTIQRLKPFGAMLFTFIIRWDDSIIQARDLLIAQDEVTASNSRISFRALPDWATYTADEATAAITNVIFNGQTQAQVEAAITTAITNAPNTIAGLKTVMGQLFIQAADQIITIRGVLVIMGKMLVWLRDVVIRRA